MPSIPDVARSLKRAALDVEALVLPVMCLACEGVLPSSWDEGPLCAHCRIRLRLVGPPRCGRCGQTLDSWDRRIGGSAGSQCGFCREWPDALHWAASAVWLEDGPSRDLVHGLKYDGWRVAAKPMARAIARHCGHLLPRGAILVPVPLGAARLRERGHNQAEVLARELAALTSLPLETSLLARTRETRTQTALSPVERKRNVAHAFAVSGAGGQDLILIDDVLTTGATLCAAAGALAGAGFPRIGALTFARAANPS